MLSGGGWGLRDDDIRHKWRIQGIVFSMIGGSWRQLSAIIGSWRQLLMIKINFKILKICL